MSVDRRLLSRVVVVANGKGGVGKTSTATTLAGLASAAGYEILLIDLDPQGNVGEDLGYSSLASNDHGASLVASLIAEGPLKITISHVRPHLDVVAGGERLDDLAGVLLARHTRGNDVADVLARSLAVSLANDEYDLVIIDCPPGEPNLQLLALGAARWLIIPTRGDAASLKGMARIALRMVEARERNPSLELLGVVLFDLASAATRARRQITAEIDQALGGIAPLFSSSIRHSVSAMDARRRGLLIHEHAAEIDGGEPFWKALREGRRPSSPGSAPALAGDYAALVHEILTRISELESVEGSVIA